MEIIVTAFATLVAAGCFIAIVQSDLADSTKPQENTDNSEQPAE